MVLTVLEAHVAADKAAALEQQFTDGIKQLDAGIVQTSLLHSSADPTLWRIETLWESREVLAAMRQAGTPRGVLMFRAAEAEPALSVFQVVAEGKAG